MKRFGIDHLPMYKCLNHQYQKTDLIDPAVGIEMSTAIGDEVTAGQPLCWIHHNDKGVDDAVRQIRSAFAIGDGEVTETPLILRRRTS